MIEAEDRLFFLLTYLKTYTLQVVQGRLFGMLQGKAKWIGILNAILPPPQQGDAYRVFLPYPRINFLLVY